MSEKRKKADESSTKTEKQDKQPANKWQKIQEESKTAPDAKTKKSADQQPSKKSAPAGDQKTAKMRDRISILEQQLKDAKETVLRTHAEMDNTRRRAERDVSQAHKYGNEKLLKALLPILDSLVHGLEGEEPKDEKLKSMWDGMQLTLGMFEKTLTDFKVEFIAPAKGEAFNPEFHEAMTMIQDPDAKPNTIVQVFQRGYILNGRVMRAAKVIVSQ